QIGPRRGHAATPAPKASRAPLPAPARLHRLPDAWWQLGPAQPLRSTHLQIGPRRGPAATPAPKASRAPLPAPARLHRLPDAWWQLGPAQPLRSTHLLDYHTPA